MCFCEDDVQDSGEPCVVEWLQCEVCDAWMHCSCTGIEVNDMCYTGYNLLFQNCIAINANQILICVAVIRC